MKSSIVLFNGRMKPFGKIGPAYDRIRNGIRFAEVADRFPEIFRDGCHRQRRELTRSSARARHKGCLSWHDACIRVPFLQKSDSIFSSKRPDHQGFPGQTPPGKEPTGGKLVCQGISIGRSPAGAFKTNGCCYCTNKQGMSTGKDGSPKPAGTIL